MKKDVNLIYSGFILFYVIISSCKCNDCDYNYSLYQIENKLTTPVEISFVKNSDDKLNINMTINCNEIKDVIYGRSGLEAFGPFSYDTAFVRYNDSKYMDTLKIGNSLLSLSSYMDIEILTKNGKSLYISRLTIDDGFIKKYIK